MRSFKISDFGDAVAACEQLGSDRTPFSFYPIFPTYHVFQIHDELRSRTEKWLKLIGEEILNGFADDMINAHMGILENENSEGQNQHHKFPI